MDPLCRAARDKHLAQDFDVAGEGMVDSFETNEVVVGHRHEHLGAMSLNASIVCASEFDSRSGLAWGGEGSGEGWIVVVMRKVPGSKHRTHDAVDDDIASSQSAVLVTIKREAGGEVEGPVPLMGVRRGRVHDERRLMVAGLSTLLSHLWKQRCNDQVLTAGRSQVHRALSLKPQYEN